MQKTNEDSTAHPPETPAGYSVVFVPAAPRHLISTVRGVMEYEDWCKARCQDPALARRHARVCRALVGERQLVWVEAKTVAERKEEISNG